MPLPANTTTVVVLGTFNTPEGNPSTGTITFTPSAWLLNSGANIAIPNSAVSKTLGTAGNFSVTLPITDDADLSPNPFIYTVTEVIDGVSQSYNISIPGTVASGGTVYLADLAPVVAAGPEYYSLASSLAIGTVTTLAAGSAATASITGLAPNQILSLGIPTGPQGSAGPTGSQGPTGPQGSTGPQGVAGSAATITVGTVGAVAYPGPGTVTNSGSSSAAILDFVLVTGEQGATGPQGSVGPQGPAATIAVGTVTSGTAGGTPSVTNSGTTGSAVLDFVLIPGNTGPQGATGPAGSAATIAVGTVTSVPFGGTASVTNVGSSTNGTFDFVVVTGPQGALGDLSASAPLDYTGNNFSLRYGAGLGTASGGTLVADFFDGTPAALSSAGAAGTSVELARGDHVHIRPTAAEVGAVGTATAVNAGTALAGGGDLTTSRTLNVVLSDATPAAVGTPTAGTAVTPSRADHVHEGTTLSSATPQALGVAAAGTATTASRGDHVHALPTASAVGAVGTATAITAGTALAGGGDLSTSRTLNVVLASTNPAALGTAASPGTATASVARSDHVHVLPTAADIGAIGNSLIAASKGGLITSTGSAVAALTVGTDGHVLVADSGQTNGIKWAAVGGGKDDADNILAVQVFG